MIHIGFTGTQTGMSDAQAERVADILRHKEFVGHHGDCIGADANFHTICKLTRGCAFVVVHPPVADHKRAHVFVVMLRDAVRMPKPYLDRNRDIVNESTCMIACPKGQQPELRSGTWSTIRYARSIGKPLAIVFPNGAVAYDGPPWP